MLVLLPPSEGKAAGGVGPRLDLTALSYPSLNRVRRTLVRALVSLAAHPARAREVLGLSERQEAEVAANAALRRSPTLPAMQRYTGVLYDALDYPSLRPAGRAHAEGALVVASALFGLLSACDPIPAYRLSGGTTLPGVGGLPALWRPAIEPVLHSYDGLVVDLRSGAYAALARVPGAVTPRVVTERPDGSRVVVSHHNKATKGLVARALVTARATPTDAAGVLRALRAAGLRAEPTGPHTLDVLT